MKIRTDFGEKEKKMLLDEMKAQNAMALKGKRDLALEFYKASMKELNVHTFIKNIKKNYYEKKRVKLLVANNEDKSKYLSISSNERKVRKSHIDFRRISKEYERIRNDDEAPFHDSGFRPRTRGKRLETKHGE